MDFKPFHKHYFNAKSGAFSRVTEREDYDSQITLTDIEADIVIDYFGKEHIHVGGVREDREKASKRFLLYPDFTPINLNLTFPKPNKPELRLYLAASRKFRPIAGQIWFIYENINNDLIIGAIDENLWNNIDQDDIYDDDYQTNIEHSIISHKKILVPKEGKIVTATLGSRLIYVRNPLLAVMRFQLANFKCEIDPNHDTFKAEATKMPYVEAHHFIPIKFQAIIKEPLDNLNNIISLCPNCHRGIHHAVIDYKLDLIKKIYKKRPEIQNYQFDDIAQFYNCIKIPNN